MSSSSGSTTATHLLERADVHKSCKAIEILINLFNDYCETTNALVGIQKKLYKALKDVASVKGTAEVCANAFGSASSVFESATEVDAKYSKIIDKECESISAEIRKWFKKLAKEERAHEDRLQAANEKIRLAGQSYEKAARRKANAALEEHTRYMNIISSVGPEVSQDKFDHAAFVTQRHTKLLLGVAATLTRVSDAEWTRQCERVRRCAGLIGEVAQWRAYCEGEWAGRVPSDLRGIDQRDPDPFSSPQASGSREGSGEISSNASESYQLRSIPSSAQPTTPTTPQPQQRRHITPLPSPSTQNPPLSSRPPSSTNLADQSQPTTEVREKAQTPAPRPLPVQSQATVAFPEKLQSEFDPSTISSLDGPGFNTLTSSFPAPPSSLPSAPNSPERGSKIRKSSLIAMNITPNLISPSTTGDKIVGAESPAQTDKADSSSSGSGSAGKGSRVAAMRDKYDKNPSAPTSPSSPPPREDGDDRKSMSNNRRTSVNVADLASRYEPIRPPLSPTADNRQAVPAKMTDSLEELPPTSSLSSLTGRPGALTSEPGPISDRDEDREDGSKGDNESTLRATDRARRMQELRQIALEEQEKKLQEQRKRLEDEAHALQEERRKLQVVGTSDSESPTRPPRPGVSPYSRSSYSQSYTHIFSNSTSSSVGFPPRSPGIPSPSPKQPNKLVPPRKARLSLTSSSTTSLVSPIHQQQPSTPLHPFDCNCVSCVLARPADAPNPIHLRTPKTEKKGFFRRLSMEVGNTFSLSESSRKRSNSNLNLDSVVQASTINSPGLGGYYGVGSGIASDGRYGQGRPNEIGMLQRNDYVSSRR